MKQVNEKTEAMSFFSFLDNKTSAVAGFFVKGGREGINLVRCLWVSSPRNLQIWRLRNAIFSTRHEICLRKKSTSNKLVKCESLIFQGKCFQDLRPQ